VMLVTPLRDGMNLVAKEFVASRPDEDGVLVLSEFAGAAAELAEALQVNPYDLDSVAQVIKTALNMPTEERQARIRALRHRVRVYDSYRWAETFIEELKTSQDHGRPNPTSSREEINELTDRLRSAPQLLLLLDYDGTLVPFANTPDLAAPDSEVKTLLNKLSARPRFCVHVLSGRTRETLQRWLGSLPIGLHGEHGFWSRMRPESSWASLNEMPLEWKAKVIGTLEEFASATPGSLIEEKSSGFAWHYRMTDPDFGGLQAGKLVERLGREHASLPVDILSGDKVVEIRSQGVNKGIVASSIIADHFGQVTVLAMGDDQTDEDLFAALPEGSVAIHVGPRPSRAPYRLADTRAARNFLSSLL
jgi:trehalose 6-phosphate synthase/phosphatase